METDGHVYQREHERINQNNQQKPLQMTSPSSCVRMENSEVCTLYDHKNRTTETSCMVLAVGYALLLSVSFKPISDDFTLVID